MAFIITVITDSLPDTNTSIYKQYNQMKAEHSRRDFLAKSTLAGMAALTVPITGCAGNENIQSA